MSRGDVLLGLFFLSTIGAVSAKSQDLRVLSRGVASPRGGSYPWYSADADPEDPNNLIVCGMGWNAKDNANYGFVYSSQDGGKTWQVALEDKGSKWVSEESCAFGVHGVAYFVADASKIDEAGGLHHEHGTTDIWVSHDSGRTWSLGTVAGWTDCSSSVVDRTSGPNQNRLYIFFNSLWTYYASVDDLQGLQRLRERFSGGNMFNQIDGLISYKSGDRGVSGPLFDAEMWKKQYNGTYTHQNLILRDGSLLTLFWSKASKETGKAFILAAQHTDPNREKLYSPTIIYSFTGPLGGAESACNSVLSAPAVYDSAKNVVSAIYLDGHDGKCSLMVTTSTDDGRSWSAGHALKEAENREAGNGTDVGRERYYSSLAFARNQDGILAILWRDYNRSNCWYFAASTDGGEVYSHPTRVNACSPQVDGQYYLSDDNLFFQVSQADESNSTDAANLKIGSYYNQGSSHVSGISVSPDGVFHPVWIASENGGSWLRTAAIAVISSSDGINSALVRSDGWRLLTNKVKFLYGGSQHYDAASGVLTETVVVRNSGPETLRAPLRLEVSPSSLLGFIYPLDVTTEGVGPHVVQSFDISQYIPSDGLPSGASSSSIPITFRFEPYGEANANHGAGEVLGPMADISLRLLTKEAK